MEPSPHESPAPQQPPQSPPTSPPHAYVLPQVVVPAARPRRRSWLGVLILLMFGGLALLLLSQLVKLAGMAEVETDVHEKYHSLARHGKHKIAVVEVSGAILDGEGFVKDQLDHIRKDDEVQGIVLRIDSPGGTVTGSDYLYHHLVKLTEEQEIPLVVSMGGIAASGGYYIAMAVGDTPQAIYAEPTTWTGSIGVIIPHYNVEGLMKKWEVEEDSIKSHPLKALGSPTKKLSDQERGILQGLVDDSFTRFKEIVSQGRPQLREAPEKLDAVATGQVFTTRQAIEAGLVDREGFIEDALERVIELAALTDEHKNNNVKAVKYHRQEGLLDAVLFGPSSRASRAGELAALLDLLTPRAYYLTSFLPALEIQPAR